jgi:NADH:ubiquinone oxidoreductase subunit 4 (subunit M)
MILLAVLLPIAAGILILPLKIKNRNLKLTAMMLVLGVTTALCVMLALGGDVTFHIWQMTENLSLDLKVTILPGCSSFSCRRGGSSPDFSPACT